MLEFVGEYRLLPSGPLPSFVTQFEGRLDRDDGKLPIPVKAHAENLAVFLPRILVRRWQAGWGQVLYRTVAALAVMEYVYRGDPDFGYVGRSFGAHFKGRLQNPEWIRANVFGTRRKAGGRETTRLGVWASGERGPRGAKYLRVLPFTPVWANGYYGTSVERGEVSRSWRKAGEVVNPAPLGMGVLNPKWLSGAPGQHWLGVYPDLWDRVPASLPMTNKKVKRPVNLGKPSHVLKRKKQHRNRKWWGLWLPRTDWNLPEWAGFDEVTRMGGRVRKREKFKGGFSRTERKQLIQEVGLGREIDWQRWVYNGWHTFDGAVEAVQGCADPRVRERLGTHPFSSVVGGPGSPLQDPRGKPGEAGNFIDVVETDPPWVYVRFSRKYKRELFKQFELDKKEWDDMVDEVKGLSKPVRKMVEPFLEEARSMTEREKHTHIMGLGDGVGSFCKNLGEFQMTAETAYKEAFPDRSSNTSTVKGAASRLMKDDRVALGVALFCLSRSVVVKEAAQVKFEDLYSRAMEVYQASLDTMNHKEALNALKFIADISGHSSKGKSSGSSSGVNVNILNQSAAQGAGASGSTPLNLVEDGSPNALLAPPGGTREQKAKDRIRQLANILDTRQDAMEWVNTNSLKLEEEDVVEVEVEDD